MRGLLDPLVTEPVKSSESQAAQDPSTVERGSQSDQPRPNARRKHRWTQVHSHYALMGGYGFDFSQVSTPFAPNNAERLILAPTGLVAFAGLEPDLIPDISDEQIRDKSKADTFTKSLVCIQATWFIVQVVGRLSTNLPISLLEMNTFLHALCCLLIYMAWWDKPLDIEEPALIDGAEEEVRQVCAYLIDCSSIGKPKLYTDDNEGAEPSLYMDGIYLEHREEETFLRLYEMPIMSNRSAGRPIIIDPTASNAPWSQPDANGGRYMNLRGGQSCFGHCIDVWAFAYDKPATKFIRCSPADIERFRLSHLYIEREQRSQSNALFRVENYLLYKSVRIVHQDDSLLKISPDSLAWLYRACERNGIRLEDDIFTIVFGMGVTAAGTIYGGVHLIAWHSKFPSLAEKYIWRVSCFTIGSPFPIWLAICSFVVADALTRLRRKAFIKRCRLLPILRNILSFWDFCKSTVDDMKFFKARYIAYPILGLYALFYTAARIFLVVECFINLAHLPDGAFQEPQWSKYIPHLGSG
jgi:hypothetical protein